LQPRQLKPSFEEQGKSNLYYIGEDHGRCEELGVTTLNNPSGEEDRHVKKVVNGTRETLLGHF
jgi:hypothetical protein